jgi:hypothetical protein
MLTGCQAQAALHKPVHQYTSCSCWVLEAAGWTVYVQLLQSAAAGTHYDLVQCTRCYKTVQGYTLYVVSVQLPQQATNLLVCVCRHGGMLQTLSCISFCPCCCCCCYALTGMTATVTRSSSQARGIRLVLVLTLSRGSGQMMSQICTSTSQQLASAALGTDQR